MSRASAHTSRWAIGEVVFGLPFLAGIALHWIVPRSLPYGRFGLVFTLGGVALLILGLAIIVLARREFAQRSQPTDPGHPTTMLVTTGIFAISRNPLYLGATCVLLGLALALNLPWAILSLVPAVIACHYLLIAPEERYLTATFGDEYLRYAATVRRWLGRARPAA
ncbi:MAG TPA: isoprenylcysteine carboxylmethyltransferase family protein, partial [Herpetosiphonaceae bacterium]